MGATFWTTLYSIQLLFSCSMFSRSRSSTGCVHRVLLNDYKKPTVTRQCTTVATYYAAVSSGPSIILQPGGQAYS